MFVPHANEIWTKSYGPKYLKVHEILSFLEKKKFFKPFWQSVDAILEDVSVAETID